MKRELLDNGNIWQKSDGRWIGLVRYKDEFGVAQRKSFSSKKKKTLQAKMTEYVKNFNEQGTNSDEARKPLKESMKNWLRVYKFPEVERTTYDRYECTAEHQIYPYIGKKPVGDVTPADIKKLLTKHMNAGYAFTTSKKAYSLLKMFFKQLYQEGAIPNNPMALIDMTKKDNYLAAQNKESKPQCDLVVVFTDDELEKIREEACKRFANGKPVCQQSAAYFLMLNTGLRAGELCGIINSDIDLENRVIHLQRGVKEVHVRDGYWMCREYIGIGPSAHSFFKGKRFFYGRSMEEFRRNIIYYDGTGGSEDEYIMLTLRLKRGLRFKDFRERFQKEVPPILLKKAERYASMNFMERDSRNRSTTTPLPIHRKT